MDGNEDEHQHNRPVQGPDEGGGVEQQGPVGQDEVALPDVLQQLLGHA